MEKRILTWLGFGVLSFVFFLSMHSTVYAQQGEEGMCVVPTGSGQKLQQPVNFGVGVLKVSTSSDTVSRGNSVQVWVESVSHGCPPYTWQVSGTGFHFHDISGPAVAETGGDGERLELWADSSACGSGIITVTDNCEAETTASVRQPNNGRWVLVHEEYCGTVDPQPGGCDCTDCSEVIVGGYKYRDCWFGGTTAGSRYHGPTCSKWPDTEDLSHSNCGCAGYYYPFGVVGLYDHFMWEWRCN